MEKEEKRKGKTKTDWKGTILLSIGLTVVVFVVIFVVTKLLMGETTKTEEKIESVKTQSLTCTAEGVDYPIFTYDKSVKKETRIAATFSGEKMQSISLSQMLYYNDKGAIKESETRNHAAMNISFGENNLGADAFNANYSKLDNAMRMNLFAKSSEITLETAKYFMLETVSDYGMPKTLGDYKENYEKKGFSCEQKTE